MEEKKLAFRAFEDISNCCTRRLILPCNLEVTHTKTFSQNVASFTSAKMPFNLSLSSRGVLKGSRCLKKMGKGWDLRGVGKGGGGVFAVQNCSPHEVGQQKTRTEE